MTFSSFPITLYGDVTSAASLEALYPMFPASIHGVVSTTSAYVIFPTWDDNVINIGLASLQVNHSILKAPVGSMCAA